MRIGRTLPPAAAPIGLREVAAGFGGLLRGRRALDRFAAELRSYFGVKHCFLVNSGKSALTLILLALKDLYPGRDEVVFPAFTCYSVPASVLRAGLRIGLCDLAEDSLDMDPARLSAALSASKRPIAVVATHLYGIPSDVAHIRQLVADSAIAIVEDAAQAMGETRDGRKLGTLGDVGFLSLGRGKALSTVEGGIILTDRDDIAEALGRRVGSSPGYGFSGLARLVLEAAGLMLFVHPLLFWIPRSLPFLRVGDTLFEQDFPVLKMSPFQAGMAANWVEKLAHMRSARAAHSTRWREMLAHIGRRGSCAASPGAGGLLRFPLRVADADRRRRLLQAGALGGSGVAPAYPMSINRLPELGGKLDPLSCPVAERYAEELVTLPTHEYVTERDVAKLSALVSEALQ
jgi:dTDP-4-amino-4,6-dideoxygalactose transaminase